jgi:integrase/recombinase XerD
MTDKAISPLRRRLIEDMAIRRLSPKTQLHYIRHVKRFADLVGRSADKATAEDVRRYQLWLASIGTTVPTINVSATALRFFFKVTLRRHDLAEELVSTREPRRLPVVLSSQEVGRLLAAATNIKHKVLLSLAYATGLRASEVVSLKLTDIDRDRMVIRVEQGKSLPSRKRGAKRIGMSFSRPSCLRYCINGGVSRARRDGCLPVSAGCFPATAGSIPVRASSTASFAWQRGAPALPNVSAFIHCGTALPRISWSRRPISGLSRCCWGTRSSTRRRSTPASPLARSARSQARSTFS